MQTTHKIFAALAIALLGVPALAGLGAADTSITGTVIDARFSAGSSTEFDYVVASDVEPASCENVIGGRGASFAYQFFNTTVPQFNDDSCNTAAYGSCGSSCGKRGILDRATSSEGFFNCADTGRYVGECSSKPQTENRWTLFGATDSPLTASEYAHARNTLGGEILTLPLAIGTIVISYNLDSCIDSEGSGALHLTPQLLSRMLRGDEADGIKMWNHADLVALNPCLASENTPMLPVIRSDGSGTTFAFSDFLARSVGAPWTAAELIGSTVQREQACPQNAGVSSCIMGTYGAFGYLELTQALVDNQLHAYMRNLDGQFVRGSPDSGSAAAAAAAPALPASQAEWTTVSIAWAPGAASYPIATFTYGVVFSNPWDVRNTVTGMEYKNLYTAGQYQAAVEMFTAFSTTLREAVPLGYSPIPEAVAAINLGGIERMHYGPRQAFHIDAVSEQGYPLDGMTVTVTDGVFLVDRAQFVPAATPTIMNEGAFVEYTGPTLIVGPQVFTAYGPAEITPTRQSTVDAPTGVYATVWGQVVGGVLVVHGADTV